MNQINATSLLNQIRTLGADLQPIQTSPEPPKAEFSDMLKNTLNAVNDAQQHAAHLKTGFETGTSDKSLAEVMIAGQKANLSFRAVTEVRNKLVTAYQDIMNMPV
ncbi:MAG: flagellar hook-basal body complex protein FliE [Gammaproteobacteria bacterium]|nr:flagellar hook-basal body complex protein FliE [Gammaproteobacteria bacterium]